MWLFWSYPEQHVKNQQKQLQRSITKQENKKHICGYLARMWLFWSYPEQHVKNQQKQLQRSITKHLLGQVELAT